jgi:hypothetical protein
MSSSSASKTDREKDLGDSNGEAERLVVGPPPLALTVPGMRLPYNSPRLFAGPFSANGGAPKPKLPRGTGTPPFFSNLAILSRNPAELGVEAGAGDGEVGRGPGDTLRCWSAAIRSFRLIGGACTLRFVL